MTRLIWCASIAVAALTLSTPASAQYRFDRRIDPQVCSWRDLCDYGGRAIRYRHHRWASGCHWVSVESPGPGGGVVIRRERHCPLRVRG